MKISTSTLNKLGFYALHGNSFSNDLGHDELHSLLNDECVYYQELIGQDTWSFSDGSFITRNLDGDYFEGNDISDFEATAFMNQ